MKNVSHYGFIACAKEIVSFSGSRNITINYLAMTSAPDVVSEIDAVNVDYSNNNNNSFTANSSRCQHVKFSHKYVKPPYLFVSAEKKYDIPGGQSIFWVSKITTTDFIVCSDVLYNDAIKINFVVKGSVKNCPPYLQYYVNANNTGDCGCIKMCSTQNGYLLNSSRICGSNGVSYDSKCEMYKHHCEQHGTKVLPPKVAHSGGCASKLSLKL